MNFERIERSTDFQRWIQNVNQTLSQKNLQPRAPLYAHDDREPEKRILSAIRPQPQPPLRVQFFLLSTPTLRNAYGGQSFCTDVPVSGSTRSGSGGKSSAGSSGGGRSEGPAIILVAAAMARGKGETTARYIQKGDVVAALGVAGHDLRAIRGGSFLPREKVVWRLFIII